MNAAPTSSSFSKKPVPQEEDGEGKMNKLEKRVEVLEGRGNDWQSNLLFADRLLNLERRVDKLEGEATCLISDTPIVERVNVLTLIPEEIWTLIFNYLPGQDLETCFETCKLWRDLLQKKRVQFLFKKVLPFLTSENDLDTKDLINSCRGVCREWKSTVDDYLLNINPCSKLATFDNEDLGIERIWSAIRNPTTITFGRRTNIERFIQATTAFHSGDFNPFVKNRCVSIRNMRIGSSSPNSGRRRNQMWTFAEKHFFPKYAPHINLLSLDSIEISSEVEFYKKVVNCTRLLPHLQALELIFSQYCLVDKSANEMKELECLIENNDFQLPPLPHLSALKVKLVPTPMLIEFIRRCKGITKLQLEEPVENYFHLFRDCKNAQITELSWSLEDEESLLPLGVTCWPLKTLRLSLRCGVLCKVDSVLDTISLFPSLQNLTIEFKCGSGYELHEIILNKYLRLRLPLLKSLTVVGYDGGFFPYTIDYILPLTSLQELKVVRPDIGRSEDNMDPKNVIQFYDYFDNMYKSNIWEEVASLKKIDVKWCPGQYGISQQKIYWRHKIPKVEVVTLTD